MLKINKNQKIAMLGMLFFSLHCTVLQAGEWRYRVQAGESLWTISQNHLTGIRWVGPLQRLNKVQNPRQLPQGTELRVPLAWTVRTPVQAQVQVNSGQVSLIRDGQALALRSQTRLSAGDVLRTGDTGHVTLRFPEGSLTRIFPNSEVQLEQLQLLGNSVQLMVRLALRQGRSESIVRPGAVVQRSDVMVSTPFATTSVRGTYFRVSSDAQAQMATTAVLQGSVAVASRVQSSEGASHAVTAGNGSVADAAGNVVVRPLLPAPTALQVDSQGAALHLQFAPVPGAHSYQVDIAEDAEFNQVLLSEGFAQPPWHRQLDVDGVYYLRVRALDADGLEGADASARVQLQFSAANESTEPAPPQLYQPANGASVEAGTVRFVWQALDNVYDYQIEIAQADANGAPIPTRIRRLQRRSASMPVQLGQDGQYTGPMLWRARVLSRDGRIGPFGAWSTFTLQPR